MRKKTRRHQQLEILDSRYELSTYEKDELQKLEAGYQGELKFDGVLGDFIAGTNIMHVKDYSFYPEDVEAGMLTKSQEDASHVQLDNLVIARDFLYTFEIKNYNFDLFYDNSKWYFENGNEFASPLMQLARQRDLLGKLLRSTGHQIKMFNVVVFINENQTIYNLPTISEIIVRSSLHKKLSKAMVRNNYDYSDLVSDLNSRQAHVLKHQRDTTVDFLQLEKGVFCDACGEKLVRMNRNWFRCGECDVEKNILFVVNRLINELKILNSSWTLTPTLISLFSGGTISDFYVRSNLKTHRLKF